MKYLTKKKCLFNPQNLKFAFLYHFWLCCYRTQFDLVKKHDTVLPFLRVNTHYVRYLETTISFYSLPDTIWAQLFLWTSIKNAIDTVVTGPKKLAHKK